MFKLTIFLLSLIVAILVLTNPLLHDRLLLLGAAGYIGAFFTGFFFVISFTVLPASAVLFVLAETYNPYMLALIGGLGSVLGDYVIYRFFRIEEDTIAEEITRNHRLLKKLLKLRSIRWLSIIVGSLIIASPFPDEIGIVLLGITKLEMKKFLPLSFFLNTLGIFLIVGLGKLL